MLANKQRIRKHSGQLSTCGNLGETEVLSSDTVNQKHVRKRQNFRGFVSVKVNYPAQKRRCNWENLNISRSFHAEYQF